MRIAYFDSNDPEVYFDNPNLIWSDPSVILEPGDAGYVGPVPTVAENKPKKGKRMKHNNYYPIRMAEQPAWLLTFAGKLPTYATTLGLTTAQVTALVADCLWLAYVLQNWLNEVRTFSVGCTQTAAMAQTGDGSAPVALDAFTAPALPAGVTPQLPGALIRIFAAVQQIKASGKSNPDIDRQLGIVGSETPAPDLSALLPVISAKVNGSHVDLKWGFQGNRAWLSSCEIVVDRADGKGYVPLTIDTTPNYNDTQPFPSAKTVWTYKAIYRADDKQVGQWSTPVSVTVGG